MRVSKSGAKVQQKNESSKELPSFPESGFRFCQTVYDFDDYGPHINE